MKRTRDCAPVLRTSSASTRKLLLRIRQHLSAFVEWLFSSETGKAAVTNDLGFIAPFDTFSDDEKPTDPLAQEVLRYMADTSKTSVSWNFTSFPSQQFKDDFGAALLEYASGSIDWGRCKDKSS